MPHYSPILPSVLLMKLLIRASPVALHLHPCFIIRDVDANAGAKPNHPGIRESWMNCFAGDAELPAFCQVMQGACYQLKTKTLLIKRLGLMNNWLRFNSYTNSYR